VLFCGYLNGEAQPPKERKKKMSLSRKFLAAMGIEADKIDEIISAHTETVDALKDERDRYKADAEKLPQVQEALDKANQKITELGEADAKDRWKVKYDALKEESDKYRADVEAEKTKQKKSDAYRKLLKETGVSEKRLDAVMRVTDLDKIEFDEAGNLKDTESLKKSIKEEWAEFIPVDGKQGADVKTPPQGDDGAGAHTPSRAAQVAAKRYEMIYGKKAEETK
jgi:hypothetical protein